MKRILFFAFLAACLAGVQTLEANKASEGEGWVITLSPYVLILDSEVDTITLHSNIPIGSVIRSSLALDGVAPYYVKADSLGCLVAKFRVEAFGELEPGPLTLTLTGILVEDGVEVPFAASDSITVK